MSYLDSRVKTLVKKQTKISREALITSMRRQKAHDDLAQTLARAILKGQFLSQDVWTIPAGWVESTDMHFTISMWASAKSMSKKWENILNYMKEHCYRLPLVPGITITYSDGDSVEIRSEDNVKLAAFIKKYNMHIVCPDVDEIVETLERKTTFVKTIRGQLKAV